MNFIRTFLCEEEGVTAIEYGLIGALVAVVIVAGAGALGTNLDGIFQRLANCVATPTEAVCALVI